MFQQKGRVDHVCFIYKRENLDAAIREIGGALNISDWDGPVEMPFLGIVQAQSLASGIEVLSPLDDQNEFGQYLERNGEGFFALIQGVSDLEDAVRRASESGAEPVLDGEEKPLLINALTINNGSPAHQSWENKVEQYRETPLKPVAGINIYLGEIVPKR